jgi:hypothetical protein
MILDQRSPADRPSVVSSTITSMAKYSSFFQSILLLQFNTLSNPFGPEFTNEISRSKLFLGGGFTLFRRVEELRRTRAHFQLPRFWVEEVRWH